MTDVLCLWLADQILAALAASDVPRSTAALAEAVGVFGVGTAVREDDVYPILLRLLRTGLIDGHLTPERHPVNRGLVAVWERPRRATRV